MSDQQALPLAGMFPEGITVHLYYGLTQQTVCNIPAPDTTTEGTVSPRTANVLRKRYPLGVGFCAKCVPNNSTAKDKQ